MPIVTRRAGRPSGPPVGAEGGVVNAVCDQRIESVRSSLFEAVRSAVVFGSPLVLVFCLAAGIVNKGRIERRLLILAAASVAVYIVVALLLNDVYLVWRHPVIRHQDPTWLYRQIPLVAWFTIALAALVYAVLSVPRLWPFRRLAAVLGVVMTLPLMLLDVLFRLRYS